MVAMVSAPSAMLQDFLLSMLNQIRTVKTVHMFESGLLNHRRGFGRIRSNNQIQRRLDDTTSINPKKFPSFLYSFIIDVH
jgi:hypothetical protein